MVDLTAGFVGYTDRQKIALDDPVDWDPDKGFVSRKPRFRQVEVAVEPGTELLKLGTPNRAKAKNKHFQFSSILCVDLESPTPLWHASCAFLDTDGDHLWERAHWKDWMVERAMIKLINLLPNRREDFRERAKLDKQKYSLHMRLPVTEIEKSHVIARQMMAVRPLLNLRDEA